MAEHSPSPSPAPQAAAAAADTSVADSSSQQLLRESDFSTSSVDRFLREHGFDINDHAGLELSSLSDDDDFDVASSSNSRIDNGARDAVDHSEQTAEHTRTDQASGARVTQPSVRPSIGTAASVDSSHDDNDDELLSSGSLRPGGIGSGSHSEQRSFLDGGQSASEEEEPVTPRFTLLHDKDRLLVESASERTGADAALSDLELSAFRIAQSEHAHAASSPSLSLSPSPQQPRDDSATVADDHRDLLDRSMVLGVGSDFSGFSSNVTDERSRIAQTLHDEQQQQREARTSTQQQQHSEDLHDALSGASSFPSGSRRVQDDELSDALGVTLAPPERDADIRAVHGSSQRRVAAHAATRRSAADGGSAGGIGDRSSLRPLPRALFAGDASEQSAMPARGSSQLPPTHTSSIAPMPAPVLSRSRSVSVPSARQQTASTVDRTGDSTGISTGIGTSGWSELNDKLRAHGLQTIAFERVTARGDVVLPSRESLLNLVQDVVLQLERKDQIIQDIILESNRNSREQSRAEDDRASTAKKVEATESALESARGDVAWLQAKLKQSKVDADEQAKQLKQSRLRLQQQLKVSEHRVKAKEVLAERLQLKLQQHVDREAASKRRDANVFRQLAQRDVKKSSARDSDALEAIGALEAQRESMQSELDTLRAHVTALNAELRDKDNYIARRAAATATREMARWDDDDDDRDDMVANDGVDSRGVVERTSSSGRGSRTRNGSRRERRQSSTLSAASDDMLLERLEAARRDQEQAATKLRRREAAMLEKVSSIERELVAAHETIAELKDENANLTLEAESRPRIRDYRLAQRRIHALERQVSESKLALQDATDLHELRKYMGTKDLVARDRLNHTLHLNRLHALPRETALEVVKDVCRVLHLTDITLIAPSLEKLCRVVAAVPRMEKFIRDVCGFVFLHTSQDDSGDNNNNSSGRAGFELEQVLPTLQQWTIERRKLHALEEFKASIVTALCKRSVEPTVLAGSNERASSQPTTLSRAVHIVAELIELEKNVLHHREIYTQAAEELERRPSVLVNQIVRHFSHLFQVKSIDGVLPKINAIYLLVNEMDNFFTVVRGLLHLKPHASVSVCLNAIRDKLERNDEQLPAPHEQREPSDDRNVHVTPNFVVEKRSGSTVLAAAGTADLAGVRQVREMTILVRDLKRELGAASMHEILPRTKRLMELLSLSIHDASMDDDDDDRRSRSDD